MSVQYTPEELAYALNFAETGASIEPTDERVERILAARVRELELRASELTTMLIVLREDWWPFIHSSASDHAKGLFKRAAAVISRNVQAGDCAHCRFTGADDKDCPVRMAREAAL